MDAVVEKSFRFIVEKEEVAVRYWLLPFAQTMKLETTAEVILIDLNGQYGGVETMFSIESNRSLADLIPVIGELNESHIRNVSKTQEHSNWKY